ncbi:MAG: hypothetical protein ACMXX8_03550, partial [Candidatus Woesearchaeota archaeon]
MYKSLMLMSIVLLFVFSVGCSNKNEIQNEIEEDSEIFSRTFEKFDPLTRKQLPSVTITTTNDVAENLQLLNFGIFSMPSSKDHLIERGFSDEHPQMRVIGPSYQIIPQGESFGGIVNFTFCYFDEDIGNYDENLFYIAKEGDGGWEKIGGVAKPLEKCVEVTLT